MRTDIEIIARQAKIIFTLQDEIANLKQRLSNISEGLVCIGGPLNDNKLCYNKAQLVLLQRILEQTED